jgi:hypothetical protein
MVGRSTSTSSPSRGRGGRTPDEIIVEMKPPSEAVTKAAPGSAPDWGAAAMELSADLGFPVGFSICIGHDGQGF